MNPGRRTLAVLSLVAALPWLLAVGGSYEAVHLALERSAPSADEVLLEAPSEIRLWFTQEPQEGATSLRLLDGSGELVPVGEVAAHPDSATVFAASVEEALAPGDYSVSWRTMAADGHVVRGDFGFRVDPR